MKKMYSTGLQFKDTLKNKVYLWLYEVFGGWSHWFIKHCDMEPIQFTEEEIELFGKSFLKNVEELAEIDDE